MLMEEGGGGGVQSNVYRHSLLQPGGSFNSSSSSRSTSRGSTAFRRLHSNRTSRKDARATIISYDWIRGNRLVFWLILITLWTYLGFYIQSRWAHSEHNKSDFISYLDKTGIANQSQSPDTIKGKDFGAHNESADQVKGSQSAPIFKKVVVRLTKKKSQNSPRGKPNSKKSKRRASERRLSATPVSLKPKETMISKKADVDDEDLTKNSSYGLVVGPFGRTEENILDWSPEKRMSTCARKGSFARLVWSRKFMLVFHELSLTGVPLSMMELASELMSCGATVSAVVLSEKGDLRGELIRRGIKILPDKAEASYKAAIKANLVIAGSAACESWIEPYLSRFPTGFNQITWWIMENRKEYFDRSKNLLSRVRMLIFLSDLQLKQWLGWCDDEHIKLKTPPQVVPLSVNDELAFVAGIHCSLNTPSFTVEKMKERKQLLRDTVRKEMGLTSDDMLIMSIASINPGKGQLLLLESTTLAVQGQLNVGDVHLDTSASGLSSLGVIKRSRALLQESNSTTGLNGSTYVKPQKFVKMLIGSHASVSNEVPYLKDMIRFLSQHPSISKSVLWSPVTPRVASLYAAADVYVTNSQGPGETFGRVTIEAMAFGLPVLGTDAGGTKEIVEHNVTGLLHPVGRHGNQILAQNIHYFLQNPSVREQMGKRGRIKVQKKYLKNHMYTKLAKVFALCMKIK